MVFLLVVVALSAWFLRRVIGALAFLGLAAFAVVALIGASTALLFIPHALLSP